MARFSRDEGASKVTLTGIVIPHVRKVVTPAVMGLPDYQRVSRQRLTMKERVIYTRCRVVCQEDITIVTVVFL
jgi:hypothetical protein